MHLSDFVFVTLLLQGFVGAGGGFMVLVAGEERHRERRHQAAKAMIGRGAALETRVAGRAQQASKVVVVGYALTRDELGTRAALGLPAGGWAQHGLAVLDIEDDAGRSQAGLQIQGVVFDDCHIQCLLCVPSDSGTYSRRIN